MKHPSWNGVKIFPVGQGRNNKKVLTEFNNCEVNEDGKITLP
jgi:hypothetical protein